MVPSTLVTNLTEAVIFVDFISAHSQLYENFVERTEATVGLQMDPATIHLHPICGDNAQL